MTFNKFEIIHKIHNPCRQWGTTAKQQENSEAAGGRSVDRRLFIELVFHFVFLRVVLVAFLEVFRQHDVSVFSDGLHPSLPAHTDTRINYVQENFSWMGEFFTGEFAVIYQGGTVWEKCLWGNFPRGGFFAGVNFKLEKCAVEVSTCSDCDLHNPV